MTINRDVSPLGNHSLTISVEDDEGFQTETTVHYFLEEDTKPTGLLTVHGITTGSLTAILYLFHCSPSCSSSTAGIIHQ